MFTAAIAFAVAAIPTGLPAVVTRSSRAARSMLAKANAIVKRLRSAETLGSTSAINSDKTGTLTLNQMTAVELTIPGRRYTIDGQRLLDRGHDQARSRAARGAARAVPAADGARLRRGREQHGEMIGDPTEGALVVLAEKGGLDVAGDPRALPARRRAAVRHRLQADGDLPPDEGRVAARTSCACFVKGAPDQLLARAAWTLAPDDLAPIAVDDGFRDRYLAENERLGKQGLRVLATGRKDFDPATFDPNADLLPLLDGLTVLALVGIVDPPRPAAKAAIAIAKSAGIQVRMITGDHAVTAEAIARELGIEGRAITGASSPT